MYGVGIIGCGTMGTGHAGYFSSLPEVKVVACADVVEEAAQRLAAQYEARAYTDGHRLLADQQVDIAVICTPTPFHAELIEAAAKCGKHIFSEKPLARTLAEARRAIAAAEKAGACFMVGHVLRFFPEYALAKRLLDEGAVGRPAVARTARCAGFPRVPSEWYADPHSSGGPLMDMAIHDIDFLLWCFGPAQRVYCKALTYRRRPKYTDYGLATVRFHNRAVAHVEGSWMHTPGTFFTKLEIAGDQGLLEYDSQASSPMQAWIKAGAGRAAGVVVPESPLAESPYLVEVREFMECVRTGRRPSITPQEAYNALEVALAMLESARSRKVVTLPLEPQ